MSQVLPEFSPLKIWMVWRVWLDKRGVIQQDPFFVTADEDKAMAKVNEKSAQPGVHFEATEHEVEDNPAFTSMQTALRNLMEAAEFVRHAHCDGEGGDVIISRQTFNELLLAVDQARECEPHDPLCGLEGVPCPKCQEAEKGGA